MLVYIVETSTFVYLHHNGMSLLKTCKNLKQLVRKINILHAHSEHSQSVYSGFKIQHTRTLSFTI
jgi:hypothetical protein